MAGNAIVEIKTPEQIHTRPNCGQEIITDLVRVEDYKVLKKDGGPRPDQISLALRHYLQLIRNQVETGDDTFRNAGARKTVSVRDSQGTCGTKSGTWGGSL